MMRIWLNLLTNAVKYGRQQGQIWLTLKSDGKNAVGTVRDDGIGISAAELPKIWKRFYRVNTARSSGDDSGTGLGLAMVKWMVESHGGTVSAVSTLGARQYFQLYDPLRLRKINRQTKKLTSQEVSFNFWWPRQDSNLRPFDS